LRDIEDPIGELLNLHQVLDTRYDDGDNGNFLFGWQCENPFAHDLLAATRARARDLNYVEYSYLEDDIELIRTIIAAHEQLDSVAPKSVFCGAGATALLVTVAAHLRLKQVEEVYFIAPIYFSMHFALRLLGIRARPVSSRHAFEGDFSMNLPNRQAVLILTDPIWYAGVSVPEHVIEEIRRWQSRTDSLVVIDGSFQYMPWSGDVFERTAHLDSRRTLRLISPSKSLCVAGYRFAYLILPESLRAEIAHTYTNIYASSATDAVAFGHEAVQAMTSRHLTNNLMKLAASRHTQLRATKKIESIIDATCGYFVFEKLNAELPKHYIRMGGEYFDQTRFPEYTRLNLLSPSFHLVQ
jgi:aspartate/methionine/tyrosine aminotransferase